MSEQSTRVAVHTRIWQTLRFRFALWTAGLLLIVLASFGLFVYLSMASALSASVDDALRLNGSQALVAVEVEDGRIDLPDSFVEGPETSELRSKGFVSRILTAEGHILHEFGVSSALPVTTASLDAARQQRTDFTTLNDATTGNAIRLYTVPIIKNNRVVGIYQVGQALTSVQATLQQLLRALVVGVPALVLIAGIGGYVLAARALAPINEMIATARRISAEELSARLNLPRTDDEVGRLAATFDEMLARLDDAFQRERQFTADASHELRTPLAAMQTILEVTRAQHRTPEEYEQALDDLAAETARLRGLRVHKFITYRYFVT